MSHDLMLVLLSLLGSVVAFGAVFLIVERIYYYFVEKDLILQEFKHVLSLQKEFTDEQIASVCLSMRHDFGLMSQKERELMMSEARSWEHAFRKERELANRDRNE